MEIFSGKTAKTGKQDFHIKVFLITLFAAYAHPTEEKVIQEYKANEQQKHDQKIECVNSLAPTQYILIGLFIRNQYQKAINAFNDIVEKNQGEYPSLQNRTSKNKPKKPC